VKTRIVILEKPGRTYVFRYTPGSEDQVVDEFGRMAEDSGSGFDWLDAAQMSFEVTRAVADECSDILGGEYKSDHFGPPGELQV